MPNGHENGDNGYGRRVGELEMSVAGIQRDVASLSRGIDGLATELKGLGAKISSGERALPAWALVLFSVAGLVVVGFAWRQGRGEDELAFFKEASALALRETRDDLVQRMGAQATAAQDARAELVAAMTDAVQTCREERTASELAATRAEENLRELVAMEADRATADRSAIRLENAESFAEIRASRMSNEYRAGKIDERIESVQNSLNLLSASLEQQIEAAIQRLDDKLQIEMAGADSKIETEVGWIKDRLAQMIESYRDLTEHAKDMSADDARQDETLRWLDEVEERSRTP